MSRLPSISDLGRVVALALAFALPFVASADASLVKALVGRCDRIDDEIVGKDTGHAARLSALRCMAGDIGPVRYVHHDFKNGGPAQSTSFGTTISEEKAQRLGAPKIPPPKGKYDTVTPPGFDAQLKGWVSAAKATGDAQACAEIGAAVFLDAHGGKYGMTEQRMFKCFALAGEAGVADAKFMTAVCLWYGIGTTRNTAKAKAMLKEWKAASGTTQAVRGGWVARRFAEINR